MIKLKRKKIRMFSIKRKNKDFLNSNSLSEKTRYNIIVFFIYIFFIIIILKLINLQIFQHLNKDEYVKHIVYKETEEIQQRGFIFDRNNNVLARSIKTYDIALDAKMIKDLDLIKQLLSKYDINLSKANLISIKARKSHISIKKNIPENIILKIKEDISKVRKQVSKQIAEIKIEKKIYKKNEDKLKELNEKLEKVKEDKFVCIKISSNYKRSYPENTLASHVIGKINSEGVGIEGIEASCNEQLNGENIRREQYRINGYGNVYSELLSKEDIEESKDVVLTIDRVLQFIVEDELKKGLHKTKAKKGVAIIQNPHNGEILAMASLPNFNPNEPILKQEYLRNSAIYNSQEPGSTFKIVVLSAVIEEHLFNLNSKINCENGYFKYAGKPITDHQKQGIITVQQILERSSNVGTAKMAIKLGKEKFYTYIKNFGFASKTGIDLPSEQTGLLAPIKQWSKRTLPTISFGQEISATPLQIISAYSLIANDGILLKPKIIRSIDNKKYENTQVVRRVISKDTAHKIRLALYGVVENGTGKFAKVKGYTVGGKTGTAQKYDKQKKQYSTKHYMASFCGMIPAMKPEIVILVIYDEPDGDYYASSVVAPIFSKMAERVVEYLQIKPDIKENPKKIKQGANK